MPFIIQHTITGDQYNQFNQWTCRWPIPRNRTHPWTWTRIGANEIGSRRSRMPKSSMHARTQMTNNRTLKHWQIVFQDLTHQLNATVSELNTTKNSWPPWLSKTLSSIKEVANKKDLPGFYSIHSSNQSSNNSHASATPTFISHINTVRRDSAPYKNDNFNHFDVRRESAPVLKDSQSYNSLRTHNWIEFVH